MSLRRLLDWLEAQPGGTWQQRWQASGAEQSGKDWAAPLAGQVIRPGLAWLLDQPYYKTLAVVFTQIDPAGLDALQRHMPPAGPAAASRPRATSSPGS